MATFVTRRLIASFFVLLAATFLMYNLIAFAGDPLEDLRASNAPNKEQLIEARIRILRLDVIPPLRYFIWLFGDPSQGTAGVVGGNFGLTVQGRDVNALLEQALGSTIQLVTIATVVAIVLGLIVGITTALRQYSGYDYTVTFISFLFFSLPIFWVAVLLKQFVAIGFNDFLEDDPQLPIWLILAFTVVSGLLWASIIPGDLKRKITTFALAAGATASVLVIMNLVDWFTYPGLTILGVALISIGTAVGFTALITGLKNRRALYAALAVAGLALVLYFPFQFGISYYVTEWWMLFLLGVAAVGVSLGIGWFMGGVDKGPVMKVAAFTGFFAAGAIALDRFMMVWDDYASSGRIRGRPIATIGSSTPNLEGSLWVQGVDIYTHLLLPTIALILISFATYTRYSRASLLEVMNQDYIRTARAKGLHERTVVVRHAFRNALIPIATIVAFDIGGIVGGAVITETVFGWTGMGQLFINGLNATDPNPVMAFFLVVGGLAILFNLIADLVYAALDPRIRVN